MKTITIVLADDHVLLRTGLKLLLEKKPNIKVVGEASDGTEAIKLLVELKPEILILDISMPKVDGIECIKEIKNRGLKTKVIILTMHSDEEYIREVISIGAKGYIQKGSVDTELFLAIKKVSQGDIYLNKKIADTLIKTLVSSPIEEKEADNPYVLLSPREREVLKLLSKGYLMKDIAEELALSIKTVDTYKTRIMVKLDLTKRSELVEYAIKYNLLSID